MRERKRKKKRKREKEKEKEKEREREREREIWNMNKNVHRDGEEEFAETEEIPILIVENGEEKQEKGGKKPA